METGVFGRLVFIPFEEFGSLKFLSKILAGGGPIEKEDGIVLPSNFGPATDEELFNHCKFHIC